MTFGKRSPKVDSEEAEDGIESWEEAEDGIGSWEDRIPALAAV